MIIDKPEFVESDGELQCRYPVQFKGGTGRALWYRVSSEWADLVSFRMDAPVVALLIPAMARGEAIHIVGTISERLYYSLSRPFQHMLRAMFPSLTVVDIHPQHVESTAAQGVAAGFSGGIDSFCLLADHHYAPDVPTGFRLTHLLYNNVGSHGRRGEELFRERYERLKAVVERIGLPFIAVNSNLDDFYAGFTFEQTNTVRNASVALLLQRGLKRWLYASSFKYADLFIGPKVSNMAYADPFALSLLSTEALDMLSVGGEYSRVEKTLRVAKIQDSYTALDVCVRPGRGGEQCSRCEKCLRTLLTLEIAGALPLYRNVFNLDVYSKARTMYIAEVLRNHTPFHREIVSFAKECGYKFPVVAHVIALMRVPDARNLGRRALRHARAGLHESRAGSP
ncbi:MAG: hypothetical protein RBR89_01465 [Candidatus Bipolaricaulis sp.]|nr:hypothetical protein [Candidatus Bipolaricaulis sp.]